MTRDEFVQKAVDAGLSDDDIKNAMNDRRKSIGAFDDEQPQQPAAQPSRIEQIGQQAAQGKITGAEGVLQAMGETARPVNEAIGKGIGLATSPTIGMLGAIKKAIPGPVKEFAKKYTIPGQAYAAAQEAIPFYAEKAGKTLQGFETAHPRAAADIGAVGQIAGLAGLGAGVGSLAKAALPKALETAGQGLENIGIKGRQIAWKPAGNPDQVAAKLDVAAKNDIWGKAAKAAPQTDEIIGQKYAELKKAIDAKSGEQGAIVDPMQLLDNAESKAIEGSSPTNEDAVKNAFDKIKARTAKKFGYEKVEDPTTGETSYTGGQQLDLADAQLYKQQLGEWADDAFDVTKKGKAVSAQSGEHQAYINAYDAFKTGIEDLGPPGVKEANQELSKLLELRRDMRKRASVEERNNFIPLDEVVTLAHGVAGAAAGHVAPLALYGAQHASKIGAVNKAMYKAGQGLQWLGGLGEKPIEQKLRYQDIGSL